MTTEIAPYVPQFLWKFWLSNVGPNRTDYHRLHVFTPEDCDLTETRRIPEEPTVIFKDFDIPETSELGCDDLLTEYQQTLREANEAFRILEKETESILSDVLAALKPESPTPLTLSPYKMNVIRKFFVFLWYRNSQRYSEALTGCGIVTPTYFKWLQTRHYKSATPSSGSKLESFALVRRRTVLLTFRQFLRLDRRLHSSSTAPLHIEEAFLRLCRPESLEILISIANGKQQYVLGKSCYGLLDKGDGDKFGVIFFPLTPTAALYLFGRTDDIMGEEDSITVYNEKEEDVDLRNAIIFQSHPQTLYFSSLSSMALSITALERNREETDTTASQYLSLRIRCRQKDLKEGVTKTLILKGTIPIADLTEEVRMVGDSPIAFGGFADVWRGVWKSSDPEEEDEVSVAVKVLRQQMTQDARDNFVKRLKEEVLTWHRLSHPSIATLFGIVQLSMTLGMVSSWCDHGTIKHYLREVDPDANRVNLLLQVASGVSYLHNFRPTVIHGDLKGSNILVDQTGHAKITDFGLSRVIEDFSDVLKLPNPTSFFAGSTRWLAPELIWAMVEDLYPPITTHSDVYAFGAVAMEVLTGLLPFPLRKNDHGVTVDILADQKPSHCASMICIGVSETHASGLREMMDNCWHKVPTSRPSMGSICQYLGGLR